jgi:imidazolonepropionase-like amidohydrolase
VRAPIEVGAPADLLVVGESPLGDIAALDDIRLVVRAGEVVAEN